MEKIIHIEEFHEDKEDKEGFRIITDKQSIEIGIGAKDDCCASHGYFWTPDNIKEWEGAELKDIKIVDIGLNKKKLEEIGDLDGGDVMFIDFETNKGVLQFTAYNSHNGYYGNIAYLKSQQLNHEEVL
jgi:hypothetical protein